MIKTVIVEDDLMVASINSKFAKRNPNIQIVTTFHNGKDAEHINEALQLGIVDYLIRPDWAERNAQALDKYLVRKKAIESGVSFTQEEIDRLVNASTPSASTKKAELQKGVQKKTLDKIRVCLSVHPGNYLMTSFSSIRRYMNFLIEENEVISQIDYSTGGRPSILYQINL